MTDPVMSPTAFKWFLTVLTMIGVAWVMLDVYYLATRLKKLDMSRAEDRDKRFAWILGILIGVAVTIGVLKYHGVA